MRQHRILDLVITNAPDLISVMDVVSIEEEGLFTEHCIIIFEFSACTNVLTKHDTDLYSTLTKKV